MKDFYAILQVSSDASPEVIRAAYVTLSKKHHPDKGGNAETFKAIAEAYSVLKDDGKRAAYETERKSKARPARTRAHHTNGANGFPSPEYGIPQPYPGSIEDAARDAMLDIGHQAVDVFINQIFRGRR